VIVLNRDHEIVHVVHHVVELGVYLLEI